jgi:pyruvate, water dikinase
MTRSDSAADRIIDTLRERAKELHCLYRVHEILSRSDAPVAEICRAIVEAIPAGWQHPSDCFATLTLGGEVYQPPQAGETAWVQGADILAHDVAVGRIDVFYTRALPDADEGPFLKEERKLIDTIAARLGEFAVQRGIGATGAHAPSRTDAHREWPVIVEFLRRTDPQLLARVTRRMINHLCWLGVEPAQALLAAYASTARDRDEDALANNRPLDRSAGDAPGPDSEQAFALAAERLTSHEIFSALEKWTRDDKAGFLLEALDHQSPLNDIAQALDRFQQLGIDDASLSRPTQIGLRAALARRILTDDASFVQLARTYLGTADYAALMHRVIAPPGSHGKLGGKSAGLLLASAVLRASREYEDLLGEVQVPRTWYLASDTLLAFIDYNDLDDVYNRKYLERDQIRRDYPHIVQLFKHSRFPPEIVTGLSVALDEFGERPIIVRSSSLLEDRMGATFSGKYKSLFLANQGDKRVRLGALLDAVAEVYASLFGPDPIEYRVDRGLLDFHEEMAVMIQEVVGTVAGRYFLPVYAGVAFSNNEFRWSPRIRREDGLVRMVPGLGTRAVDRLSDDYPMLIAPGQPGLRVAAGDAEVLRYAPRKIDVIDLGLRRFETMEVGALIAELGRDLPAFGSTLSIVDDDGRRRPAGFEWNPSRDAVIVTFDGLVERTPFIPTIRALLRSLSEKLGGPVDIEFASDGLQLYLLQCRSQSFTADAAAAAIPADVPPDRVIFSAHRYVSNGRVPDLTHVVYVDPDRYQALGSVSELHEVGHAIGRLNALLPKRRFALLGPGRWGSRGDVKLGVPVSYSDISNTAMLIEVARTRGHYVPDVSFGTHFFQDLVEAGIRYLPLYPDEPGVAFNEAFLLNTPNLLAALVPEHAGLAEVIHVIDVPQATGGLVLRVAMNADIDEALAFLAVAERARRRDGAAGEPQQPGSPRDSRWW